MHGRTKEQKGLQQGAADWRAIGEVKQVTRDHTRSHEITRDHIGEMKQAVSVPVIANGGVDSLAAAEECLAATGADAVMCILGRSRDVALRGAGAGIGSFWELYVSFYGAPARGGVGWMFGV